MSSSKYGMTFYFNPDENKALAIEAARSQISKCELLRRLVSQILRKPIEPFRTEHFGDNGL